MSSPSALAVESPQEAVGVRLASFGLLVDGGTSVRVRVAAACRSEAVVLEAFVTVSQDNAWGDGFFPLSCDGTVQRFVITVSSYDQPFVPGSASGSAYVLVENPNTGKTDDATVAKLMTLR